MCAGPLSTQRQQEEADRLQVDMGRSGKKEDLLGASEQVSPLSLPAISAKGLVKTPPAHSGVGGHMLGSSAMVLLDQARPQ